MSASVYDFTCYFLLILAALLDLPGRMILLAIGKTLGSQGGGLAQPQSKRHGLDSITSSRTWHLQCLINCAIWHRNLLAFLEIALITAKRALCSGDFISAALSQLAVASISGQTDSRRAKLEWSFSLLPTPVYVDPFKGLDVNSCRPGAHLRSFGAMGELQRSRAGSIGVSPAAHYELGFALISSPALREKLET